MRRFCLVLLVCSFATLGIAQRLQIQIQVRPGIAPPMLIPPRGGVQFGGDEPEQIFSLYDSVAVPDRTLSRRIEQADRLFEVGRTAEAAQLLGNMLESADFTFLLPEQSDDEEAKKNPQRTLHRTVNRYIIDRLRQLPKEARDSYAFQFEPTARRLLEDAVAAGSLDDIQQVARKYFPTASGASAAFLVGFTQFERGDYAAATHTLENLKQQHLAIPDAIKSLLEQTLAELKNRSQRNAEQPQFISESAWLEHVGWRIPTGSPHQNTGTTASAPLLEQNWTVPLFNRLPVEREANALVRLVNNGSEVYIPASQPLVVGNLFITRTLRETVAIDINSGKRLWIAPEPDYRFPEGINVQSRSLYFVQNTRAMLRMFFWHDRISQQLSSDGERVFAVDEHDLLGSYQAALGRALPNLPGRGEDRRFDPGNTLTARDLRTGRILWQVGKFPYVQKYIDASYAPRQRGDNAQPGQQNVDDSIFSEDEKTLKETWFLGAPLPLYGRLYVIGETDGVLQLFVLESHTGRVLARQPFAQASTALAAHFIRRTYPLFPSASEGIIVCPTGNGLITALDATTLAPLWCYTYAPPQSPNPGNRNARNMLARQQQLFHQAGQNESTAKELFSNSGWQVPGIVIDGHRVLVAPADRAALYCLDLLSGKLLWEQSIARVNTLYVAGIQGDKAFLVTPGNVMTIDMNNGDDLTTSASRFPSGLNPAGVGVRSGNQYFVPLSNAQLAVADLTTSKITLLDASGRMTAPTTREAMLLPSDPSRQKNEYVSSIFTPDLSANELFQEPIQLGNLVGIKGRFFSQSPTQISSFDQTEPLRQRAEALLQADANDPEGLLQRGRILKAEGKISEAIDAFRASWKAKPTVEAADLLRRNLLEAMRKDYPAWAHVSEELESLSTVPNEWGAALHAQIEGILQSGRTEHLAAVLEKVFAFGQDPAILIPVSSEHSTQLHRALGCLVEQTIAKGNRSGLKAAWEEIAEKIFSRYSEENTGTLATGTLAGAAHAPNTHAPTFAQALQSTRNFVQLPPEIQQLTMFAHVFRNTAAAEKSQQMYRELYERHRLPLALGLQSKPQAGKEWSQLPSPFVWKTGTVEMQGDPQSNQNNQANVQQEQPARKNDNPQMNRLLDIARNPGLQRGAEAMPFLPFFGAPDSELAEFSYVLKQELTGEFSFCCCDLSGRVHWQLALPNTLRSGYQDTNRYNGEYATYVKGFQHFLLFVHGTSMTAIDTTPQAERILWSKTVSSLLISQQNSMRVNNPNQRPTVGQPGSFPKNSVFVSPQIVCCWDINSVYGLDPLTGQTLWVRRTPSDSCTIMGDGNHLFLVFPDIQKMLAVDPISGRELANGSIPPDGTYIYGTNIVCTQRQGNEFTLLVGDLRNIHDKRRRALEIADTPEGKVAPIPMNTLHDKVRGNSMLQVFRNDRFLSVATWETKSLQVYDLLTKKPLLPVENKILEFVPDGNIKTMRCEVELVDDKFLVLFTKDSQIASAQVPYTMGNKTVQHRYQAVPGISMYAIGEGAMMLIDAEGKPCWSGPTKIEKLCRLLDVSDRLPVMLFAVSITETESGGQPKQGTGIRGFDKRTGEKRFGKHFAGEFSGLQQFRVSADPVLQEIIFTNPNTTPQRWAKAIFTDK